MGSKTSKEKQPESKTLCLKTLPESASNPKYLFEIPGQIVFLSNYTYQYKFERKDKEPLSRLQSFEKIDEELVKALEMKTEDGSYRGNTIHLQNPRAEWDKNADEKRKDDPSFYKMMDSLCGATNDFQPSFLLFYLMAHGDGEGNIYLGSKFGCRHVNGEHKGRECARVNIKTEIFDKIQKSERFIGKPKIFIIEACRGDEEEKIQTKDGGPSDKFEDGQRRRIL